MRRMMLIIAFLAVGAMLFLLASASDGMPEGFFCRRDTR